MIRNPTCWFFFFTDSTNLHHIHAISHQMRPHLFETFDLFWMTAIQKTFQTRRTALTKVLIRILVLVSLFTFRAVEVRF